MTQPRSASDVEAVEIGLLLEGVFRQWGFDFRDYAYPAVRARVRSFVRAEGLAGVSELQGRILRDRAVLERLLAALTVRPCALFGDPDFWRRFREKVLPRLRTYPSPSLWLPGCSTGEEVWSLAILLHEEGLHKRARIYATETAESVVAQARAGACGAGDRPAFAANLEAAGARGAPEDYFDFGSDGAGVPRGFLRGHIVFAQHNLVTDGSFNEFNVVLCRNTLMRFNRLLADRVQRLFHESLGMFGFLIVGRRETIRFSEFSGCYEEIDGAARIYRRAR